MHKYIAHDINNPSETVEIHAQSYNEAKTMASIVFDSDDVVVTYHDLPNVA